MTSPVEELRSAAVLLRQRATDATQGPWHIGNAVDPTKPCNVHAFPSSRGVADEVGWLDAEWIATMDPRIGPILADLLERTIDDFEWGGLVVLGGSTLHEESADEYAGRLRGDWTAAWRLARLILGGES